jgi:hypothetical protein
MPKFEKNYMIQPITFTAPLLLAKKTATGIQVPDAIVTQLGNSKRPPVKVTINGYTYPNTIAVMNGVYMLSVSAAVREKANIKSGDLVKVTLELDTTIREVAIPEDFKRALDKHPPAKQQFEKLSNSNKKRYIILIEQAKTPETKNRRIEKAIQELGHGKDAR